MRRFADEVPLFVPGLVLTFMVALASAPTVARALRCRRAVAVMLVSAMGLIISATLTPVADAIGEGVRSSGTCDTGRLGFAPLSSYLHPTEASLNVLLFVPLGLAVGMLPRGRPAAWLALVVLLLPTVVEELQLVLPALGRVCQTADIIDNTTGAAIGLVIGHILGSASTALRLPGLDPPTR